MPTKSRTSRAGQTVSERRGEIDYGVLPDLVGYHLRRAQVAAFADFAVATAALNLTPGLAGILVLIRHNPGLSQTALARAMEIENSTLVEVIDKLEQRQLVERRAAPRDRRTHALHLSQAGEQLVKRLVPIVRGREDHLLRNFSVSERQRFIAYLRRFTDAT